MQPDPNERQVSPTLDGIRRDHVARYEWARAYVRDRIVIDYGCGAGYGTRLLASAALMVDGADRDKAAVDYARAHYGAKNVVFHQLDVMAEGGYFKMRSDVAVAFEIIEHLADPVSFLQRVQADLLLASVPNEHVFPWSPEVAFHYRHYTPQAFELLLNACGWQVEEWWAQEGPESEPVRDTQGRTQIAVCTRAERPVGGTWRNLPSPPDVRYTVPGYQHPTGKAPETVMLVGLGPSKYELTEAMLRHDFTPWWDELWTINKGIDFLPRADVMFHMDDVYDYAARHPAYGDGMRRFVEGGGRIIGQTSLPNDGSIPFDKYPLRQVMNYWKQDCENYLHTISVPLIIAYAGMIGVQNLMLAGIDCSWEGRPDLREDGASVVTHWMGRFLENNGPRQAGGRALSINSESALNATNKHGQYGRRWLYGWLRQPLIRRDEAGEYHVNFGDGWDVD